MKDSAAADWQALSALYEEADELGDAELVAWLGVLESGRHPLLPSLRRMLAARAEVRSGDFLRLPPALPGSHSSAAADDAHEGARVGPYRLLRRIGRGGMAEVWLADRDDGAFTRQVAIKLLFRHAAGSDRDTFVQRFARERDILASLRHPHIAGLHDAGVTTSGQPWLALEYVEGQPITNWCDERRLDIEGRVRVFRQVLLAVRHAHANLVIHRDLKPANILVSGDGEVRLLDFGIAKLMEPEGGAIVETELTRQAGRPLTLQYASPEQLLGQPLTTACDVYSLGVVLYELLCGERPYELKVQSAAQIEQAILEIDPKEPSRRTLSDAVAVARGTTGRHLRKLLAPDLDAIALRALQKTPASRYASAEALAADLEHWFRKEPVEARVPSNLYRIHKFVSRHRASVALGTAAVLGLVVTATVAVVLGLQARHESARAIASRDFLLDMFRLADPDQTKGAAITGGEMMVAGRAKAEAALGAEPELQAEILRSIAEVFAFMGLDDKADETLASVGSIYARIGMEEREAFAEVERAGAAWRMGNLPVAERLLDRAEALLKSYPAEHAALAKLHYFRGKVFEFEGRLTSAEGSMLASVEEGAQFASGRDFVLSLEGLAEIQNELHRYDEALVNIDRARAVLTAAKGIEPRDRIEVDLLSVAISITRGRLHHAAREIDDLGSRCDETLGPNSEDCVTLRNWQAFLLLQLGKQQEAMQFVPRLLNVRAPLRRAECLVTAGRVLSANTQLAFRGDVRSALLELARVDSGIAQPDGLRLLAVLTLAEAALFERDLEAAERLSREAIARVESDSHPDPKDSARAHMLLGLVTQSRGRHREALASLQRAQVRYAGALGADHPLVLLFALNQITSWRALGETQIVEATISAALPVLIREFGDDAPVVRRAKELRSSPIAKKSLNGDSAAHPVFFT